MTNQARFTINSLSEGKSALVHITPVATEEGFGGLDGPNGLGLEILNIAALPDAEDYALDEFYASNFTPAEIAYCLKQASIKAAFQGVLAAKRAIIKSGAASHSAGDRRGIELSFDADGRPSHQGCLLSISYTDTIAAAVCVRQSGFGTPATPAATGPATQTQAVQTRNIKLNFLTRIFVILVLLSLLMLFGLGTWKLLQFRVH
ncbi:hypothetical protein CU048_09220 [Beijerinckiaceae bacterium]|nr:hypothetical protein CU048_09220 [Beijerinckiaceae bacterium]